MTFVLIELSSFPYLAYYLITVFRAASVPIDPYYASLLSSLWRAGCALAAGPVLQRARKRPLYLSCALALAVCNAGLAVMLYLSGGGLLAGAALALRWMPLVLVLGIYTCFSFGYANIPHIFQVRRSKERNKESLKNASIIHDTTVRWLFLYLSVSTEGRQTSYHNEFDP